MQRSRAIQVSICQPRKVCTIVERKIKTLCSPARDMDTVENNW
jgi:hypothetical protein